VDGEERCVFRWIDHRLEEVQDSAGVPVEAIWKALDDAIAG
jgi:hypothetical protein